MKSKVHVIYLSKYLTRFRAKEFAEREKATHFILKNYRNGSRGTTTYFKFVQIVEDHTAMFERTYSVPRESIISVRR